MKLNSTFARVLFGLIQLQSNSPRLNLTLIQKIVDAEGLGKGWKTGKSKEFKYKKTIVLAQNAHLTIVCPEYVINKILIPISPNK